MNKKIRCTRGRTYIGTLNRSNKFHQDKGRKMEYLPDFDM